MKEKLELYTCRLYPSEKSLLKKLTQYVRLKSEGRTIGYMLRELVLKLKKEKTAK